MKTKPLNDAVVIFDLDGTLVDSARDLSQSLNHVMAGEGLPPVSPELTRPMVGHGALAMMAAGFEAAGRPFPDGEERDRLRDVFLTHYRAHLADRTVPFDSCLDVLDGLAADGATLSICTNKYTDMAVALIDQLGLSARFEAICGRDAFAEYKPSGLPLEKIQQASGRARAIMIGDSYTDRDAARAANLPCCLATFGYGRFDEALRPNERLFSHYDDLRPLIDQLLSETP